MLVVGFNVVLCTTGVSTNESTSVIWIGVIVGMLVLCYCLCIICKDPRNLVLCCIDYFDNSEDNGETEDSVGTEDSVETKIIFD